MFLLWLGFTEVLSSNEKTNCTRYICCQLSGLSETRQKYLFLYFAELLCPMNLCIIQGTRWVIVVSEAGCQPRSLGPVNVSPLPGLHNQNWEGGWSERLWDVP